MPFFIVILFLISPVVLANDAMKYYEQGLSRFDSGEFAEAEIAVKNSLQLELNYLPARLLLGKILLKAGKPQAAEKEFEQALLLQVDSNAVVFPLVEVKLLLGKHEEALTLLTQTPQLQSQARYYHLQANTYQALAKYKLAQTAYQQAIIMQDNNAQLYTDFAHLWYSQEEVSQAQHQLDKALIAEKNYIPALLLGSEIDKNNAEYKQAQHNISLILQIDPNNKRGLFAQADLFLTQHQLPEALAVALQLRELAPHDPYAKLLHSSIVAGQGDTKQARLILTDIKQQLSSVDNKFSDDQQVLLLSATVDFINTSYHSAKKQFLRYIELYGENSSARKNLALMALRDQDLSKAQFHIEKALLKNPNNAELYLLAAEIYHQENLPEKQFSILQKAYQLFADNKAVNDHYLASLLVNNQFEQALIILNKNGSTNSLQNKTVLAFMLLSAGLYEQAQSTTQQLLNEYPDKVEVLQLAGELSLKTNSDTKPAIYFFNQALSLDEDFSPALLALAGVYLQQNQLGQVEGLYQRLLAIDELNISVIQLYADFAIKQGNFLLAIKLLEPLLVNNDYNNGRALLNLYLATKQPEKALLLLTQLEEDFPLEQALLLTKSRIQTQLGQPEQAKKTLKILFGLVYDDSEKLAVLGHAQLDLSDQNAADKTITRILSLEQQPVPPFLQARMHFTKNEYAKAHKLIDQALASKTAVDISTQKNDDFTATWLMLKAHVLIEQKEFSSATVIVEKLFNKQGLRPQLQLLAQLYSQQNQLTELIELLDNWLKITPNDEWAVAQLSALLVSKGEQEEAISVLEQYPNLAAQPIFLNNLANYYSRNFFLKQAKEQTIINDSLAQHDQANMKRAIDYAQQAYKLAPLSAAVNDTLGWLYVQTGQLDKGLSLLREAIARDVNNGEIYYHLAYTLAELNNSSQAIKALQSATNLAPKHSLREVISDRVLRYQPH